MLLKLSLLHYFLLFQKFYKPAFILSIERKVVHSVVHAEIGNQCSEAHWGTWYVQPLSRDLKQTMRSA